MSNVQNYCLLLTGDDEGRIDEINEALRAADMPGSAGFALVDICDCGGPHFFEAILAYGTGKDSEPEAVARVLGKLGLDGRTQGFFERQDDGHWQPMRLASFERQRHLDEVDRMKAFEAEVREWMADRQDFSVSLHVSMWGAALGAENLTADEAAAMIVGVVQENWSKEYRYHADDQFIGWTIGAKSVLLYRGSLPSDVAMEDARRRARNGAHASTAMIATDEAPTTTGGSDAQLA